MKRLLAVLLLAGCAHTVAAPVAPPRWQNDITAPDRKRLARLWEAWTRALNEAQTVGQGTAIASLGAVAIPDPATMNVEESPAGKTLGPLPAAGVYRCRTIKLGQRAGGAKAQPSAAVDTGEMRPCHVEVRGNMLWFQHDSGAQRLQGALYADGDRMVFLGTTALTGEMGTLRYGTAPQRDAVGVLRAMTPQRWRLELPWPHWQSNLEIVEIVPA